mgnify:CR=1 FL=1
MATTNATANEGNTLRSAATLAAGASATHDLDLNDDATHGGAASVALQFDITDSGAGSVTVNLYSSLDSGTTFDTESLPGGFATDASGTQVIKTIVADARVAPYLQVELVNDDGSNATGTIAIRFAATKYETT